MNARVDHLLEDLLRLPSEERSAVAVALIDSLDCDDHAAVSEAWRQELRRRKDALQTGAINATPWTESRARLDSL